MRLPFKLKLFFTPKPERPRLTGAGFKLLSVHASAHATSGDVIAVYPAGYNNLATVYIVDEGGRGYYIVDEPKVTGEVAKAYSMIMEHLSYSLKPAEVTSIEDYIKGLVWEASEELGLLDVVEANFKVIDYYLMRDILGYGLIDVPMRDPLVEEVSMEGAGIPVAVVHRDVSDYTWLDTNIVFPSEDDALQFVQRLAQRSGRYVSTAHPLLEARSPEGHRIAVSLSEVSGRGSSFTIRKFPEKPLTITRLISEGTLSPLIAGYYWILLENLAFIMIIGGLASGKSVHPDSKVVVKLNGVLKETRVEDLWEALEKHSHVFESGGVEFLEPSSDKAYALTVDPSTMRVGYRPFLMVRHAFNGRLVRVRLRNGFHVDVTEDHSLLIEFNGRLYPAPPSRRLIGFSAPVVDSTEPGGMVKLEAITGVEDLGVFKGYVYDFIVPGSESFTANRVFVHNTTLLQSLLTLAPPDYKYVTIEDTPELRLPHVHWDPLYTRRGYTVGSSHLDIDLFELTKFALRRRGQFIVIGEVRGREIQALVQASASGQGSACTFHASSIEEAFMRMTSPPLSVKPAFLLLISSVALMKRVRLPSGRVARRLSRVWEITGLNYGEKTPFPLEYREVFKWDPASDSFKPDKPEDVVEASVKLKQIAELNGWSIEEAVRMLGERARLLESMAREGVFEYERVAERLYAYYKQVRRRA